MNNYKKWNKDIQDWNDPEDPGMFRVLLWIVLILILVVLSFMITGCTQKGQCPTYSSTGQFSIEERGNFAYK